MRRACESPAASRAARISSLVGGSTTDAEVVRVGLIPQHYALNVPAAKKRSLLLTVDNLDALGALSRERSAGLLGVEREDGSGAVEAAVLPCDCVESCHFISLSSY